MKEFPPGATVRVAHDARIVGLEDPKNPYWYRVAYPDGTQEVVNIGRLTWLADEVKATMDTDGSVQIISNRLTAGGALDLLKWLETHLAEFEEVLTSTSDGSMISTKPPGEDGSTT